MDHVLLQGEGDTISAAGGGVVVARRDVGAEVDVVANTVRIHVCTGAAAHATGVDRGTCFGRVGVIVARGNIGTAVHIVTDAVAVRIGSGTTTHATGVEGGAGAIIDGGGSTVVASRCIRAARDELIVGAGRLHEDKA